MFAGLLNALAEAGACVDGFRDGPQALAAARGWDVARVAAFCGLPADEVAGFYREFIAAPRAITLYTMGINQSASGSDKCNAIINVHLASGKYGRRGCGPFSLTGQPNAMGGREVGGLATMLAAHMDFVPDDLQRLARFWGRNGWRRPRADCRGAVCRHWPRRGQSGLDHGYQPGGVAP